MTMLRKKEVNMKCSLIGLVMGLGGSVLSLSADTVTVRMEGGNYYSGASDGTSIYSNAQDGNNNHWSDNEPPHEGAVYEIPAGYTVAIQGGNTGQASVDFGGDGIVLYGMLR